MRIQALHIYQRDLPVVGGPFRMASATVECLDTTILEVVTDQGMAGYGETCPLGPIYQPQHALGARAALQEMAPRLVGQNPLYLEQIRAAMDSSLTGSAYAKAAVDMACWDILGKASRARVCELLGGPFQEEIPSYASIAVLPPDQAADAVREQCRRGFKRVQLKVGGRSLDQDIEAIKKAAEAIEPGVGLVVDANRGWNRREARLVSQQCRDVACAFEQPCSSYEEILSLRGKIEHPVLLDESAEDTACILRAIADGAADGFSLKCTRVGGLSAMRTIRDVCRTVRLPITCDDSWGGDVAAAACLHIAATVEPRLLDGVWIAEPFIREHYDSENGPRIQEGRIRLPHGPGLGVVPNRSMLGHPLLSYG